MTKLKIIFIFIIVYIVTLFTIRSAVYAQNTEPQRTKETTYEGVIINLRKAQMESPTGDPIPLFLAKVEITKGDKTGTIVEAELTGVSDEAQSTFKVGNRVIVTQVPGFEMGETQYYLTDHVRYPALYMLFVIFVAIVVAIGRSWGIRSLLGLSVSFAVIFGFILPLISRGYNPIIISIIGSTGILFVNFYLSHGINQKTHIALIATAISLLITGIMATIFVNTTKLTGFSTEEAIFLQIGSQGNVNIKGLLLAGMIVGVLGILDDITISQAAVVKALKSANPKMSVRDVNSRAMKVGRDHISSLVNTLILVYAGGTFPLLLLFLDSEKSYLEVINYEIIAEEIVRTLVGSIGLILAVPITTLLAARFITKVSTKKD